MQVPEVAALEVCGGCSPFSRPGAVSKSAAGARRARGEVLARSCIDKSQTSEAICAIVAGGRRPQDGHHRPMNAPQEHRG
jgi:hypothetical protein